jgi:N-acetylneuraminic acid mutarotase
MLLVLSSARPASAERQWQGVEPMPISRAAHTSAVAQNTWYVAGGITVDASGEHYFPDVHAFDPKVGTWKVVGQLTTGRMYLAAVAAPNRGQVLFIGGFVPAGPAAYEPIDRCDLATSTGVSPISPLAAARHQHAAAVVAGKVLVTGGWGGSTTFSTQLDSAEVLGDTTGTWESAGVMPAGKRAGHTMTRLADGRNVLVVGGCQPDHPMVEVDQYDADRGTWARAADTGSPRCAHAAVLLKDGRVLVAGSLNLLQVDNSAEVFVDGAWRTVGAMSDARYDHDMILLPDGRVLVAGGTSSPTEGESYALTSTEIYDPATDQWTRGPAMQDPRRWPRLAVLSDGVYVAGGSNAAGTLATVERLTWSDLGVTIGVTGDPSKDGCSCEVAAPARGPLVVLSCLYALGMARRRKPRARA